MMSWLNSKRLRDYPRLFFIASWGILIINIIFHHGWIGGLTKYLLWGDFVSYYAAGKLYIDDISHLYDLMVQEITQLNIIGSTKIIELSIFSYPPNSALAYSGLTYLPLSLAVIFWCVIAMLCVIIAARLLKQYLIPDWLIHNGFSTFQLSILIFSSFAFIEGFEKGQSHSLTLLLIVAILITTKREKWFLAGLFAALSTYKPHFILGFLILWLVRGKLKAIVSFIGFCLLWNGVVLLTKGIDPYLEWIKLLNQVPYIPYTSEGFPTSLMATLFSFIATIIPINAASLWNKIFLIIAAILLFSFAIVVYKTKKRPIDDQNIILAMTMLIPFLVSPHALLHDLLILFPVLLLFSESQEHRKEVMYLAVGIYIAMLVLPLLGYLLNITLSPIIPIAVFIYCIQRLVKLLRT